VLVRWVSAGVVVGRLVAYGRCRRNLDPEREPVRVASAVWVGGVWRRWVCCAAEIECDGRAYRAGVFVGGVGLPASGGDWSCGAAMIGQRSYWWQASLVAACCGWR